MFRKNKLAMIVGEFLGTAALTLIVLAITHSQLSIGYFIATAAGLMMGLLVLAFGGISGAVFNPAVTIGLWTVRKLRTLQALVYIVVQVAGGWVAWLLFAYLTKINGVHNTGTYNARVLVAEVVGTFIFSLGWAAAIYQKSTGLTKAVTIGGSLTTGSLVATLASSGYLNPAVALGLRQFGWGTYVLGPVLGAVIGFNLYNLLFVESEEAAKAAVRAGDVKRPTAIAEKEEVEIEEKPAARRSSGSSRGGTGRSRSTTTAKKAPAKRGGTSRSSASRRRNNPNAA